MRSIRGCVRAWDGLADADVRVYFATVPGPKWRNWQTRTFEGRVGQPVGVRVPPSAPCFPTRAPGLIDFRRAHARMSKRSTASRAGVPQHRRHSRRRLAGGLTNKEIGALVHLSAHTIRDRLENIAAVFDVRSRAEIVAEAFRSGLI